MKKDWMPCADLCLSPKSTSSILSYSSMKQTSQKGAYLPGNILFIQKLRCFLVKTLMKTISSSGYSLYLEDSRSKTKLNFSSTMWPGVYIRRNTARFFLLQRQSKIYSSHSNSTTCDLANSSSVASHSPNRYPPYNRATPSTSRLTYVKKGVLASHSPSGAQSGLWYSRSLWFSGLQFCF